MTRSVTKVFDSRAMALIDQCIASGGNFFTMLLIGRWLPADEFGLFSLAILAVLFISNLHRAAITQPLNVLGAKQERSELALRTTLLIRSHLILIPVGILLILLIASAFFWRLPLVVGASCYLASFLLQETVRRHWYTVGRIDRAITSDLLSYGGQVVLLVVVQHFSSITGGMCCVVLSLTSMLGFFDGLRGMTRSKDLSSSSMRRIVGQHWEFSRWLLLTVLAVWAGGQIYPFLMIGLGPVVIAWFAVTRNLLNVTGVVVQSALNYLPTRAAALLAGQGDAAFRQHLRRTFVQSVVGSALFVLVVQIVAKPVLHLLYGGGYDAAAPVLRILSVGMASSIIGAVLGSYALAMQDARSTFLANLGSAVFTFTGGLWLIRSYGMYGAALASCLSLMLAAGLQGIFVAIRVGRLTAHEMSVGKIC